MRQHGCRRLTRIGDCFRGITAGEAQQGEIVEDSGDLRMVRPARCRIDCQCPLVGLLGFVVAAKVLEQMALVDQHGGKETVVLTERLGEDVERALELLLRLGVATLAVIGNAELAMNLAGVGIVRAKGFRDDSERPLGEHLDVVVAALGFV